MINFILLLIIYIGIYAVLSLSLNLIAGYTGLLSLCHAAFMAVGAYTTAIGLTRFAWGFWEAALFSGLVAALFGMLIGLPTLRLKGDYLAIATLGFGEIVKNVIVNWDDLTRGPMGISGLPGINLFGYNVKSSDKWIYLILVWIFVAITFLIIRRIIRSRLGRALEAIREDELAASTMGINVVKYKILAFTVGAFFAGLAGSLWAVYNKSVAPQTFDFMLSIMILCMVVLGGLGNQWGAILGAVIIVLASELPRLIGITNIISPQVKQVAFGLILVLMMIFKPQGILGRRKPNFEHLMESAHGKK